MKIEIEALANNEEKLWDVAEFLEGLKEILVDISMEYGEEEKSITEALTDALEYIDDTIDAVNEAADEIEVQGRE